MAKENKSYDFLYFINVKPENKTLHYMNAPFSH